MMEEDMDLLRRIRGKGVAIVVDEDERCEVLMVQEEKEPKDVWVLESGSSHHFCANREWFSSYEVHDGRWITLPNGEEVKVEGVEDVILELHNGQERRLTSVRHVPNIERNLISLGRLVDMGYTVKVENSVMKINMKRRLVLQGWKNDRNLFLCGKKGEEVRVRGEASPSEGRCSKLGH